MSKALLILSATILGPALCVGLISAGERILGGSSETTRRRVRPWLWVMPALGFVVAFLAWPLVQTTWLSLFDGDSSEFVGLGNYARALTGESTLQAIRNNLLWLALLVPGTLVFGLLLALLTERVRYGRAAKTVIFIPMAISLVAAATIWRFMYDYRPPGTQQIGTLNAAWTAIGGEPQAWLIDTTLNNPAVILVGIWALTGFAMVILSAALKGIPAELIEAARVDGATEWTVLRRITVPLIRPALLIVATTMFINAVKIFDLVWVLTGGNYGTEVLATEMYRAMFSARDLGMASTLAVILLLAAIPILVMNVRNYRRGTLR